MRTEFQKTLVQGQDVEETAKKLRSDTKRNYDGILRKIDRDLLLAKLIQAGMAQPQGSEPHRVAESFINVYRRKFVEDKEADPVLAELMKDPLKIDELDEKEAKASGAEENSAE